MEQQQHNFLNTINQEDKNWKLGINKTKKIGRKGKTTVRIQDKISIKYKIL